MLLFGVRWGVAELAKRRTVNPEIGGSNPPAPVENQGEQGEPLALFALSQRELPRLTDEVFPEAVVRLLVDQTVAFGFVESARGHEHAVGP
jgi:hypothetical protein